MEIAPLRYFLKAAERENFTLAADELGVTQPSLSRAIAKLEEELGQPLFERQTRRVVLTDAGLLLQRRAQQAIALIDDTKQQMCDDGETGTLRVGAIPTIAPYLLPRVLRAFGAEKPQARVVVFEDVTARLLKRCLDGEVDLAVLALPIEAEHLDVEVLFEEELLLVLPPGHELLHCDEIDLEDVEPYPVLLLGEGHCLSESVLSLCHERSFHPIAVGRTTQLTTLQEMVALGHGVSLIPAMARVVDRSDRRAYRSFRSPRPTRKIAAVWNPYRFQSRLFQAFKESLAASCTADATDA